MYRDKLKDITKEQLAEAKRQMRNEDKKQRKRKKQQDGRDSSCARNDTD